MYQTDNCPSSSEVRIKKEFFSLGNEGRVDKQLLYVWEARIDMFKEGIRLDLDKEVADHQNG